MFFTSKKTVLQKVCKVYWAATQKGTDLCSRKPLFMQQNNSKHNEKNWLMAWRAATR